MIDINELYEVSQHDLRPGVSSTLNELNYETTIKISLINILKFMLQESCNTSTDILLRILGGPRAVVDYLKSISINDMRIDRYTLEILADWHGIENLPNHQRITLEEYARLERHIDKSAINNIRSTFKLTDKDTTTPRAMAKLLLKLFNYELLNRNNTELMLKIMRGCKRGSMRLMGLLPYKTPIAHKTGTLTGYSACDVGVISLPNDYGHIIVAAYIKDSELNIYPKYLEMLFLCCRFFRPRGL